MLNLYQELSHDEKKIAELILDQKGGTYEERLKLRN